MNSKEFILKLLQEGREYLKIILPAFISWHLKPPPWVKNDKPDNKQ